MARRRIVQISPTGSEEITHPNEVLNGGLDAKMKAIVEERKQMGPLPRNPDGHINNCALALDLSEGETGCQICLGTCPDRALFAKAKRMNAEGVAAELVDVLKASDKEVQHVRARKRFDFEVAQAAKMSPLRADVARVVEMVFVENVAKSYRRLEDELLLGDDKHTSHGEILRALDRAESNARLAHKCYVTARVEREAWELRNHVVFAAMWLSATQALQEEKAQGARNKQITDADVRSKCAAIFGDEWAAQEIERKEAEAMVDDFKNLAERWASRCWGLSAMIGKVR